MHRLEPQALEFDPSGFPYCHRYGDWYASREGALAQARHVFLAGNDLPRRWANRGQFVILETGFGLGCNFLATWHTWRGDPQRPQRLHFVSVERHPLRAQDLQSPAHSAAARPTQRTSPHRVSQDTEGALPEHTIDDLRSQLARQWPMLVPGLHRIEFDDGRIVLTLALGDALELLSQLQLGADAFYLDGFAPDRNPRMWDPRLFRTLARLARPDATAATYTCARGVRDALTDNGFAVERRPGFGNKREMLSARFAPRWKLRRHEPPVPYEGERHAIVVGAGLAGCSVVYALRRRGWGVTLLDRARAPASEASGLPAGLLRPLLSADENRASRLSRTGFLFGLTVLQRLAPNPEVRDEDNFWRPCGVFEQSSSAQDAAVAKALLQRHAWPAEFAMFLDAQQAATRLGLTPRHGGMWFARGAVVAAGRWCQALLDGPELPSSTAPLVQDFQFDVTAVTPMDNGWCVADRDGRRRNAPVLVLANAMGLAHLPQFGALPLQEVAGRISLLASPALCDLRAGISGDGYLIPPLISCAAVGATYEPVAPDPVPRYAIDETKAATCSQAPDGRGLAAHHANLERLAQLLAEPPAPQIDGVFLARRCVSRDHLPLAGALPDFAAIARDPGRQRGAHLPDLPRLPGLFCLSALGSRGLALAPLLGEHIASLIAGEPAPIEAALSAAVDPARFLLRDLR